MWVPPCNQSDGYKQSHGDQFPEGAEMYYLNSTPRESRIPGIDEVVVFGLQYWFKEYLINQWNRNFFDLPKKEVIEKHHRRQKNYSGNTHASNRFAQLHDLGYLPLEIKALPEGTLCPLRVPFMTMRNTHKDFVWVPGFLETILMTSTWQAMTSATIALEFRKLLDKFAAETSDMPEFVDYQAHDFSMRGMSSLESACLSGMGHLTSFLGTDTIPAIDYLEEYYNADSDKEIVGQTIPASEHAIMCSGGEEEEAAVIKRLIQIVYPEGPVSIVCDSYDYWHTLDVTIRGMKDEILARNGKVCVRPDSGCPVKIICGDSNSSNLLEQWGTINILWDIFGGTVNSKGYKQLDDHVGIVYGDSITLERASGILKLLEIMFFASTNVTFGVGSYTYQLNTRDVFGIATKATASIVNGVLRALFKNPKTDSGMKRSAKGLLSVVRENGKLKLLEECTWEQEKQGCLETVFRNGMLTREFSLSEIRNIIKNAQI